jgi:glycerol-3-phosphate dehydrogenase (NAD(P)+)
VLWARRPELAEEVNDRHTNERYLPGLPLHPELRATADLAEAVDAADVIVMGVPSQGFRSALEQVAEHVGRGCRCCRSPRAWSRGATCA